MCLNDTVDRRNSVNNYVNISNMIFFTLIFNYWNPKTIFIQYEFYSKDIYYICE